MGDCGAGNRVRTGDLNLGKVALYQLSYSRVATRIVVPGANGVKRADAPISRRRRALADAPHASAGRAFGGAVSTNAARM